MKQIRFIKDFITPNSNIKKGDIVYMGKKSAESTISQGYGEYVDKPVINSKIETIYEEIYRGSPKEKYKIRFKILYNPEDKTYFLDLRSEDKNYGKGKWASNVFDTDFFTEDYQFIDPQPLINKATKIVEQHKLKLSGENNSPQTLPDVPLADVTSGGDLNIKQATKELSEFAGIPKPSKYIENQINWVDGDFWTWDIIKGHCKKQWKAKEEYQEESNWNKFFISHSNDIIQGKPQLIEQVQKRIPLVRWAINKTKDKETKQEINLQSFYFFDERFDKRHDGFQKDSFALDFWFYRIITEDGKEYYVLTQEQLPNCSCTLKGMIVELDDFAEMSRSMKLKSLSRFFFCKSFEPSVKILTKEQIVNYTQTRTITEDDWFRFLAYHPFGTLNRFPKEVEYLKSAHILSGKFEGSPLHLGIIGKQGTKKSFGYIETTAYKFSENYEDLIFEGANSNIKGLTPSFKERPANIGFLAKQERMGFVDEIGKLVEREHEKHQSKRDNILGELNAMLDNKPRTIGSGNDNDIQVQANGKFLFVMNPLANKSTIQDHVGLIDRTTMSRIFWWVQDEAEVKFVMSQGVVRDSPHTYTSPSLIENRKKDILLKKCEGKIDNRDEFLTLFDTCYSFISDIDLNRTLEISEGITQIVKEPMKSVWEPRGQHHITLLVDGLCKHRCLFKDYDSSFVAKEEDYQLANEILKRMYLSWETEFFQDPNKRRGYL